MVECDNNVANVMYINSETVILFWKKKGKNTNEKYSVRS